MMKSNTIASENFVDTKRIELLLKLLSASGIKVPESEKKVLSVLQQLKEATAPAIVRSSENTISLASVYELLKRLKTKNIVTMREEYFDLGGINTRRVFYKINETIVRSNDNQIN